MHLSHGTRWIDNYTLKMLLFIQRSTIITWLSNMNSTQANQLLFARAKETILSAQHMAQAQPILSVTKPDVHSRDHQCPPCWNHNHQVNPLTNIISYQNTGSERFWGWNQRKIQGKLSSEVWLVTSSHTWSCSPHLPPPPASSQIFLNQDLATASPCSLVGGLLSVVELALSLASLGWQATTAGLISSR